MYKREDHLDLAVLKPGVSKAQVIHAAKQNVKSVCVLPHHVAIASRIHQNTSTVIGWPFGHQTMNHKIQEAMMALTDGAQELDVVINSDRFLDGEIDYIVHELRPIWLVARERDIVVKAILEAPIHLDLALLCRLVSPYCRMLKTCTGHRGEARVKDVKIMLEYGLVKASGGIKTLEDANRFISMGCSRIGSSKLI